MAAARLTPTRQARAAFYSTSSSASSGRLVTIGVSHYCEKARWALDRYQLPYKEDRHAPLTHMLPVWWLLRKRNTTPIFQSRTTVCIYLLELYGTDRVFVLDLSGHSLQRLLDSGDILKFVDSFAPATQRLYPPSVASEIEEWESLFNRRLGFGVRVLCYFHLLDSSLCYKTLTDRVPLWEKAVLFTCFPAVRWLMRKALGINRKNYARSLEYVDDIFDQVSERLSDGRQYICGDAFTAADLTFSSLAAPRTTHCSFESKTRVKMTHFVCAVLACPNYGSYLPGPNDLPAEFASLCERLRATPAGKHALKMYQVERLHTI